MIECNICTKNTNVHTLPELNLEFEFCSSCEPYVPAKTRNKTRNILSFPKVEKYLGKKDFRLLWSKINHEIFRTDSAKIVDLFVTYSLDKNALELYNIIVDKKFEEGYFLQHGKTTLRGHTVYWSLVVRSN